MHKVFPELHQMFCEKHTGKLEPGPQWDPTKIGKARPQRDPTKTGKLGPQRHPKKTGKPGPGTLPGPSKNWELTKTAFIL